MTLLSEPAVSYGIRHSIVQGMNGGSPATSFNWAGAVLTTEQISDEPIYYAYGATYVPSISDGWSMDDYSCYGEYPCEPDQYPCELDTFSALWVGLDGNHDNSADLLQAGTIQQWKGLNNFVYDGSPCASLITDTYTYFPWYEYVPDAEQTIPQPVDPGDEVDVAVYPSDAEGTLNVNGGYGTFVLTNYGPSSPTWSSTITMAAPNGVPFVGSSAEWIMEKPLVDGSLAVLSHYAANEGKPFANDVSLRHL
jgi:hypothetical protein